MAAFFADISVLLGDLGNAAVLGAICVAVAIAAAAVIWILTLAGWRSGFQDRAITLAMLFALALVGTIVGLATGLSRVGAVGNVVPAVLVFFGGLSAYLFGQDKAKGLVASLCVVAFTVGFFAFITVGATMRERSEARHTLEDACLQAPSTQTSTPGTSVTYGNLGCSEILIRLQKKAALSESPINPSPR
jgi:hypothetical protein